MRFQGWHSAEILKRFEELDQPLLPAGDLKDSPRSISSLDHALRKLSSEEVRLLRYLAQRGASFLIAQEEMGGSDVNQGNTTCWAHGILGPEYSSNEWYLGALGIKDLPKHPSNETIIGPHPLVHLWEVFLDEAQLLARQGGATRLLSPLTLSSWFPYRLRLDHHPEEYSWEPMRVPGLEQAFLSSGFVGLERYRSVGSSGLKDFALRIQPAYQAALAKGFTFVGLEEMPDQLQALQKLWSICQDAFQKNPYFAPISFEDFVAFYLPKVPTQNAAQGCVMTNTLCISPLGEIAGFILGYQTPNELIFKSMAIDRPFQGSKLGDAVLYPMASKAVQQGIDDYISALVLEGNRSEFVFRKNTTRWEHHYGIFGRQIQIY